MLTLATKHVIYRIVIGAALAGVLGLFFGGCTPSAPESFHQQELPACAGQDDPEWYFVDCPQNPVCPTEPVSICSGADGKQRAKDCVFSAYGVKITCVAACGETVKQ